MKNTFVKVLSMMMALMMVVGMFSMISVSAAEECTHDNAKAYVQKPSCGSIGYTKNVCDCGYEWISDPKPALSGEHDYSVDIPAESATCLKPAQTAGKKCSVCGEVDPANKPEDVENSVALGHAFHNEVVVKATCDKPGYTTKECTRCGYVDHENKFGQVTDRIPAGHKFEHEVIKAPNADKCESGSIRATCTVCGYSYVIEEKHDHNMQPITNTVPNRANDPYKKVPYVGTTCEYTYKSGKYCTVCGYTEMVKNENPEHPMVPVGGKDADKKADYYLGDTIPAGKVNATLLAMSFNGVDFGADTATKVEATCASAGYEIMYCTKCKDYRLEEENKLACAITGDKDSKFDVTAWKLNGTAITGSHETLGAYATMSAANLNKTAYHCETLTRVSVCRNCKGEFNPETKPALDCNYEWVQKDKDGKVIAEGIAVTPKTCLKNGYTTYTCEFCKDVVVKVEATDVAKGAHTWSADPIGYKDGFNCKDSTTYEGAVIYVCTYDNCDGYNAETKLNQTEARKYTVTGEAKHSYTKETREATCVADAAYYNECARCGFVAEYGQPEGPTDKPAAGFDENNHVVKTAKDLALAGNKDKDGVAQPLKTGAAATCTTAQVNVYLCACNKTVDVEVAAALNHKNTTVKFTDTNYNGKFDANEEGVAAFAGNCQQAAVKQGEYCTKCKTIITKSVIGNTVPGTHFDTNPTPIDSVDPTCTSQGYDQKYYTCCGEILKVNYKQPVATAHKYKEVAEKPATCYGTGTKAHFECEYCGTLFTEKDAAKVTTLDKLVIAQNTDADKKPGHKWGKVIGKVEETCNKPGTKAYQICENCGEYLIEGDIYVLTYDKKDPTKEIVVSAALNIDAHGDFYMGFHADKAPNCEEDGYAYPKNADGSKKYCCSKCDVITVAKINAELADKDTTDPRKAELVALKATLIRLNHKNATAKNFPGKYDEAGNWVEINDCTKDRYTEYYCPDCKFSWLENFDAKDHNDHVYKTDKGAWIDTTPEIRWNTDKDEEKFECLSTATAYYKCKFCDERTAGETSEIKKHTANIDGVDAVISFECTTIENFYGLTCKYCDTVVNEANALHDPIKSVVKPTCDTDGHCIYYCGNGCDFYVALDENGEEIENEYFPAFKHVDTDLSDGNDGKVLVGHVDADHANGVDGYNKYSCGLCGKTWTETIKADGTTDIAIKLDVNNQIALAGKNFTDSSIVAVTVALDATNVNVWGIKFNLYYDENLVFIPELTTWAENNEFIVNKTVNDNNVDEVKDKNGNVVVAEAVDYVSVTASAPNGEDKMPTNVTITEETALVTLYFRVVNTKATSGADAKVWVNAGTRADADIIDNAGGQKRVSNAEAKIEVAKLMDYNTDGDVTMADVLAASKIFSGVLADETGAAITYDVTLDVDKDGEITALDLLAVLAYINGEKDFAEIAQ